MKIQILIQIALAATVAFSGCASSAKKPAEAPAVMKKSDDTLKSEGTIKKPAVPDTSGLVTCSNSVETRTLSVASKAGGCELVYEKSEKLNVVATSANGTDHCDKTREKIRKKLSDAGWKCQ